MTPTMPGGLLLTTHEDSAELQFLRKEIDSNRGPASLAILACVSEPSVLEILECEYGPGLTGFWVSALLGLKFATSRIAFVSSHVDAEDENTSTLSLSIQHEIDALVDSQSKRLLILFSSSFDGRLELPTAFTQVEIVASPGADVCLGGGSTYCGIPVFDWIHSSRQAQYPSHRFTFHNSVISLPLNQTRPGGLPNDCLEKQANAPRLAGTIKNIMRRTAGASRDLLTLFSKLNIPMPTAAHTIALLVSGIKISDRGIFINADFRRPSASAGGSFKSSPSGGGVAVGSAIYFISWETLLQWFQKAWDILLEFLHVVWTEIRSRTVGFFETLISMARKLAGTGPAVGVC